MTKATEIKIENNREDSADGFRDRRRSMKLVPARKSVGKGRSFNIGVADNMFSPRAAVVDRSGLRSSAGKKLDVETIRGSSGNQIPDTLRTIATVGIFVLACGLGFLIGRKRD